MLENSEKLKGINTKDLFVRMLGEVPWNSLVAFIQANAQLLKVATAGGHRLEKKHRDRLEKLVLRDAEKGEFSQTAANGIFAVWYPVHEKLHKTLEEYFHSDEYKAYREANGLGEEDYVLSEAKFDEFFEVDNLEEWRILLAFSPLKFTDAQADKILNDSEGNSRLLGRIKELEEALAQSQRREQQQTAEADRLRQAQAEAAAEAVELKKSNRELRSECETLTQKLDRAQKENKRSRDQFDEMTRQQASFEEKLQQKFRSDGARQQNEVERLQKELAEWLSRYEDQRLVNKQIEAAIVAAKRESREAEMQAAQAKAEVAKLSSFADLILQHIDWPKTGAAMKLTPRLRQQFNSLVRKLSYEEDRSLTIEGTLPEFWESLVARERELIESIAQSNSREVMGGDVEGYWMSLTDLFGDVHIGLEARSIMLRMLQEIFYQTMEMDVLKEPFIPPLKAND